jgi:hypothetical protein
VQGGPGEAGGGGEGDRHGGPARRRSLLTRLRRCAVSFKEKERRRQKANISSS